MRISIRCVRRYFSVSALLIPLIIIGQSTNATPVSLEPAVQHPTQEHDANAKLSSIKEKAEKRPNVIILLVDDMGWGDPGVYGGGEAIGAPTPNIDRLANNGLRLTSVYAQPTCSPTRAAINTGRLPVRTGVTRPPLYGEPGGLDGEITAARLLQENGYHTAMVGKWHLGEAESQQPQNNGYEEYFGILGSSSLYSEWRDENINPELVLDKQRYEFFKNAPYIKDLVSARQGEKLKKVKELTLPVIANLDQNFADYTEKFIRRNAKSDKPFYLVHAFAKVHFDNYPAKQFKGKSPAKHPYKDAVIEVDDIVGRIMKVLEDTGQAENTLVFFTSDNGPQDDTWPDSGHTPFRGSKGSTWEGGVRVPGIAWWPGTIKAGRVSDGLFDLLDLFNTTLSIAGVSENIPNDRYIDGIDQTSFLLSDNGESNRETVFFWMQDKYMALRWAEYKVHRNVLVTGDNQYSALGSLQNSKIVDTGYIGWVYNLYTDPQEKVSISLRKGWLLPFVLRERSRHFQSLKDYPPKRSVLTRW